jgi:flagellar FliL protein
MATPPKADSKPAGKPEAGAGDAPAVANPVIPPVKAGTGSWLPVIIALVAAPAATWGTVEFLLLPRLQKKMNALAAGEAPAPEPAAPTGHGAAKGKGGKEGGPNYEFQNVVVNLAGTMGTRYLKTSFMVTGADPQIRATFEAQKPKLMDVTLNVLSSLTLADIEEPGAKNLIREKLVGAYNQALGKRVAEQVYFSDFVVQ